MRTSGVGLLILAALVLYVFDRSSTAPINAPSQTAAANATVIINTAPTSGGTLIPPTCTPGTQPADIMCPQEDSKNTYTCDVSQGQSKDNPPKKCVLNLGCSEPGGTTGDIIVGTCQCPQVCKAKTIQVACADPKNCPATATPTQPPPSGSTQTPINNTTKPTPLPSTSGTTNVSGNPIGADTTPVPASTNPRAVSTGPTAGQQLGTIANQNSGSSAGSGAAPPQTFNSTGLYQSATLGSGGASSPTSLSGTTKVSSLGSFQSQSTFGKFGDTSSGYPSPTNSSVPSPAASFISNMMAFSFISSIANLIGSFAGSGSSASPPPAQVIVVERPVGMPSPGARQTSNTTVIVDRSASSQATTLPFNVGNASQVTLFISTRPAAHPTVAEIVSLLQQELFTGDSIPTILNIASSTLSLPRPNRTSPPVPNSPESLASPHLPAAATTDGRALSGSSLIDAALSSASSGTSNFTDDGGTMSTYKGATAVTVGTPSNIGEPWSLTLRSLAGGLLGDWTEPSSPLLGKEAALAQVQSNYEAMRAQIEDLQQVKDAGACDDTCQRSLDLLIRKLPLQRAGVNALNKSIDEEISRISKRSFTEAMRIVEFQENHVPPRSTTASEKLPSDLTGLALVADIRAGVFAGEKGNAGGGAETHPLPAPATPTIAQDPFERPIFVLDDPWLFTPPSAVVTLDNASQSTGFQSLTGQSGIMRYFSHLLDLFSEWFAPPPRSAERSCSLFLSLFGGCKK